METWAVTDEEQARYRNGHEAAHWLVHEERYRRMPTPFTGSQSKAWLVNASRPWP
jgi:hypothetical protein